MNYILMAVLHMLGQDKLEFECVGMIETKRKGWEERNGGKKFD